MRAVSREERLATALDLLAAEGQLPTSKWRSCAGCNGSHARLLAGLRGQFAAVTIDGRPWAAKSRVPRLDPTVPHDVVVRVATLQADASSGGGSRHPRARRRVGHATRFVSAVRRYSERRSVRAARTGSGRCSRRRSATPRSTRRRIASPGHPDRAARPLGDARSSSSSSSCRSARAPYGFRTSCCDDCGRWSRWGSVTSPSTGRCRRCRAVRRNGLGSRSCSAAGSRTCCTSSTSRPSACITPISNRLLDAIASLPGPVLMVEHDRTAIAHGGRCRRDRPGRWPRWWRTRLPRDRPPTCGAPTPPRAAASRRRPRARRCALVRSVTSGSASPAPACATCATSTARSRSGR